MIRKLILIAAAALLAAASPSAGQVISVPPGGPQLNTPNTWTATQTLAVPITTTQQQSLQINGAYSGTNLFNRAIQDNSTFTSATDGAYSGYDTVANMSGTTNYNHFYGYETRQTYSGSGLLNAKVGFTTVDNIQGPVNAYRHFAVNKANVTGGGSIVEQEGLYVPDLTDGSSLIAGVQTLISSGANKYQIYANGTAQSYFNGPVTFNAGQTWSAGTINVTVTNGQTFHYATNTNMVVGGSGTIAQISSLNDAANTYQPLNMNANPFIVVISGTEKLRVTPTLVTFGGTNNTFPALKRSTTTLQARLADDSDYTQVIAKGTATNDNAVAGNVGEFSTAQLVSGSAVSLTTATPTNITSLSLTAGDWQCWGVVDYVATGATTTAFKSGLSSTSATFGGQDTFQNMPLIATALSDTFGHSVAPVRFSLSATTTVYLIGQATFSVGTGAGYGTLNCRRAR